MSVAGTVDEAGISPSKAVGGLESEEGLGRGPGGPDGPDGCDCEKPSDGRRLGVFGDEGASVVAAPGDSGQGGRLGGLCIFFKLSNSGLVLGAGREVGGEAGAAAGRVKVNEG